MHARWSGPSPLDCRRIPASTPIVAFQDRGFRETYVKGTVAGHAGAHEWKVGLDADFGSIREAFSYVLSDPTQFDPSTPPRFSFTDRGADREQAAFFQDQLRLGPWTSMPVCGGTTTAFW
jgi:hypothetical protein